MDQFKAQILQGIPAQIPEYKYNYAQNLAHAPKRACNLSSAEQRLALQNALRYFPANQHAVLAAEFAQELRERGHIYMYRYKPDYQIKARHINDYPHQSKQAAGIMLMIDNNLDDQIAQHPDELITYGGNGAVFQNWAQYRLVMQYLAQMTDQQTLVVYSGHPLGLFPSNPNAPRLVVSNGMVIPNYSKASDLDRNYALGVSQYGQMTAGSYMYIGPQGIVHGTTLTILNAGRMQCKNDKNLNGKLFVSSGLGGMSGAQGKAGVIAGVVAVIAEVNGEALNKRHEQGWINEVFSDLDLLIKRILQAQNKKQAVSLAYHGNIVDLWQKLADQKIKVDLGSDQTSLHNPYAGGYYPQGLSFEQARELMQKDPVSFSQAVRKSLCAQVKAINKLVENGMYFFDYGNAFLLEASRAGAEILKQDGSFKYPSYVEDIIGPLCFDYGFGPFRWVCTSGLQSDLELSDQIAAEVIEGMLAQLTDSADPIVRQQLNDNLDWIKAAKQNNLVVGSKARILYSNAVGRIKIALALNQAIANGKISAPIVLGRDHHDVSGTDSPYRETSNINDGSKFTADMAVQNVIGDAFRGATWVSLHNGGGVGWGEVINGGFGMLIDGSQAAEEKIKAMLFWDVNNGVARRSWARNQGAISAIKEAMQLEPNLKVTLPNFADEKIIENALGKN